MNPKKCLRAKEKRRKGYQTALEKKCAMLRDSCREARAAEEKALIRLKETEAVTDNLLRSRLTLHLENNRHDRRYRFGMEYIHPREYLADPAMAFKDFAFVLRQSPSYCEPRKIPVPEIHVITEGHVNYEMSRDYPDLMARVERCLDVLAKRMAHLILQKFVEQRPR